MNEEKKGEELLKNNRNDSHIKDSKPSTLLKTTNKNYSALEFEKIATLGEGAVLDSLRSMDESIVVVAIPEGIAIHDGSDFLKRKFFHLDEKPVKITISPNNLFIGVGTKESSLLLIRIDSGEIQNLNFEDNNPFFKVYPESSFIDKENFLLWIEHRKSKYITSITFSKDNQYLAAAQFPNNIVREFSSSSDQSREVVTGEKQKCIAIWDVITRSIVYYLPCNLFHVSELEFSQDGKFLAAHGGGLVYVWELVRNPIEHHYGFPTHELDFGLHFLDDNKRIIVFDAPYIFLIDIEKDTVSRLSVTLADMDVPAWVEKIIDEHFNKFPKERLPGYSLPIYGLAISNDKKLIASSSEEPIINIWDVQNKTIFRRLGSSSLKFDNKFYRYYINLDFSPDNKYLLASGFSGGMYLWDLSEGVVKDKYEKGLCARFSPDGEMFALVNDSGGNSYQLCLYGIEGINNKLIWECPAFMIRDKNFLRFTTDNKIIVAGETEGNQLQAWAVNNGVSIFCDSVYYHPPYFTKLMKKGFRASTIQFFEVLPDKRTIFLVTEHDYFLIDIISYNRTHLKVPGHFFSTQVQEALALKNNTLEYKAITDGQIQYIIEESSKLKLPVEYLSDEKISISQDGELLVTTKEGYINIWKIK